MAAIKNVFVSSSNILCSWHIEKNVATNCKKHFTTQEDYEAFQKQWLNVVNASTVDDYNHQIAQLQAEYPDTYGYLEETWLLHKKHFVKAWINQIRHLGHFVTSRVEGQHAVVKGWIGTSSGDLKDVYSKILLAIKTQQNAIEQQIQSEKLKCLVDLNHGVWSKVHRKISIYALRKASAQMKKHVESLCSGTFTTTLGLPCVHKLKELMDSEKQLVKEDFDWYRWLEGWEADVDVASTNNVQRYEDALNLLGSQHQSLPSYQQRMFQEELLTLSQTNFEIWDPNPAKSRGRPSGTKRLPSAFEIQEKVKNSKRKCGFCRIPCHTRQNCKSKGVNTTQEDILLT
jgi:hypothetical protein